jgi:cold shock CspA family protein
METPLQLTFHQLPPSAALEVDVNRWVAELEECFDGIVSRRVVIDAPTTTTTRAAPLPRASTRRPRAPSSSIARPTITARTKVPYVAIPDTAARRRLEDHVHAPCGEAIIISAARAGRSPSRIGRARGPSDDEGREIYFHRNSVIGGIDRLALGAEVRFHEERGDEGPQASTVEPVGANGHHREAFS